MADSAQLTPSTIEGVVQSKLDQSIFSNTCNIMPTLGLIWGLSGVKEDGKGIGLPKDGIVSRLGLSRQEREKIVQSHTWEPTIDVGIDYSADGKDLVYYDTNPDRANWTTTGPLTHLKKPRFRRSDRIEPILVPSRDLEQIKNAYKSAKAAGNVPAANRAAADAADVAAVQAAKVFENHLKLLNTRLWDALAPADEDLLIWNRQHSLSSTFDDNNTYGGIDRTVGANAFWKSNRESANYAADLEKILNYILFEATYALAAKGKSVDLVVVGGKLFTQFKAQAKARNFVVYEKGQPIPDIPQFGEKSQGIIRWGETWVMYDPACPAKGIDGATKSVLLATNTKDYVLSFMPGKKFQVAPFDDESQRASGRKALVSFLETEYGFWNVQPSGSVWFEDVG